MTLLQTEPKKIYIRVDVQYKTYTITWNETSNPAEFFQGYSDDAVGLTQGSTEFDRFFGYYACRLNDAGEETEQVTQSSPGILDITQFSTSLSSGDNIMIAFPRLGIKMTKSGTTVTLSITNEPNKSGYQYYAHTKGTADKDVLYLGAYKICSGYKTLYGGYPLDNHGPIATFRNGIKSTYDSVAGTNRYSMVTWYAKNFISALYMMKYGNPNSQSVVGAGRTYGNTSSYYCGWTNSQTSATYGTSDKKKQIKLFGLEDRWGNVKEFLEGCYLNSSNHLTVDKTNNQFYTGAQATDLGAVANGWLGGIAGTNDGMFMNISATGSGTTYYTDNAEAYANRILTTSGMWGNNEDAGVFFTRYEGTNGYDRGYGARLMFL